MRQLLEKKERNNIYDICQEITLKECVLYDILLAGYFQGIDL